MYIYKYIHICVLPLLENELCHSAATYRIIYCHWKQWHI